MHFKSLNWTIKQLCSRLDSINPKPQYQRGEVWDRKKKQLLIDTVLNGFDIPKIYLRHVNDAYRYEVADGQQRILALSEFSNDIFPTGNMSNGLSEFSNSKFSELPDRYKKIFNNYKLAIAIAYDTTGDQIREVFRRLQLGVKLTPPELRNSLPSAIGDSIRAMASNHNFFKACSFSPKRFKHDDLTALGFLLALNGPDTDCKAPNISAIYEDFKTGTPRGLERRVSRALKYLAAMEEKGKKPIIRKWGFVDLMNWQLNGTNIGITPEDAAVAYTELESRRLTHNQAPEILLEGNPRRASKDLFDYVTSFKHEASTRKSVMKRYNIIKNHLK